MNKRRLVISTSNKNKVKEIKELLCHLDIEVLSKDELGVEKFDVIEDGKTLEENSMKKAKALRERVNDMVIADDSGLFVDSLGGEPGVYSSRYAGEEGRDDLNNEKLLRNLQGKDRSAFFKTVISLITQEGETYIVEGLCKGNIAYSPRGINGFGYDPLFVPQGYDKTFAQLGDRIKNKVSHRAKALNELKKMIEELIKDDNYEDNSTQ